MGTENLKLLKSPCLVIFVYLAITALTNSCTPIEERGTVGLSSTNDAVNPTKTPMTTDVWESLMQKSAYPYNTPLPPQEITALDGLYSKFEPKEATPIPCMRCPDYMVEGGLWRLNFDKGTFRILHDPTGWQGLGSFTVSGDRLNLFNDPKCPDIVGLYTWELDNETLDLRVIKDSCAADLRGHNLENIPWNRSPIQQ